MWQRRLARIQRLGLDWPRTSACSCTSLSSIFAVPFLLAFIIDKLEQPCGPTPGRRPCNVPMLASPDYRQQRLLALKHTFVRTHRVRRRERAELAALLHALQPVRRTLRVVWGSSAGAPGEATGAPQTPSRSVAGAAGRLPLHDRGDIGMGRHGERHGDTGTNAGNPVLTASPRRPVAASLT